MDFSSLELTWESLSPVGVLSYACAISDASRLALKVRTKGLRGATFSKLSPKEQVELEKDCLVKTFGMGEVCVSQGGACTT